MATALDKLLTKGGISIPGATSGLANIVAPAAAGTPTLTLPTTSGTFELTGHTHATYALDSDVVKLTGDQSISGIKTFTSNIIAQNGANPSMIFRGASFDTTFSITAPSAARTITFQNASGTVAYTNASSLTSLISIDSSTATHSLQIGYGATTSGSTKTINIGSAGVSGSTTSITLGSSVSGATSTLTVYGNETLKGGTLRVERASTPSQYVDIYATGGSAIIRSAASVPLELGVNANHLSIDGSGYVTISNSTFFEHVSGAADGRIRMTRNAGYQHGFQFRTGGSTRWDIFVTSDSESGSDAGSNLAISRFHDNGSRIDDPWKLDRATGQMSVYDGLWVRSRATGSVAFQVEGQSGQTADLQQWRSASTGTLSYVDNNGAIYADDIRSLSLIMGIF